VPSTTESRLRTIGCRVLPALIVLSAAWAVFVAVTGGVELHPFGLRLRSTTPDRAVQAAGLLSIVYVYFYREDVRRRANALSGWTPIIELVERATLPIVIALSVGMFFVAIRQGTLVAEAADQWGYVSQADLWLARDLVIEQPIARQVPWPLADWTFTPLGYRPAQAPGAIVPVYAPGLPVLMAIGKSVVGACGPFVIVPLLAGLTVWLTYLLGVQLSSKLVGLTGAALMTTSPAFVFMSLNPMSDLPVAAFFTLGVVLALSPLRWRAIWTGLAVSMAIFIRPNLVLVGAVFLGFIVLRAQPAGGEPVSRARWRAFLAFAIAGAPLVLAIAALNATLYGGPLNASYGNLDDLYQWKFVGQNLIDYPRWIWQTETPFVLLSIVPLFFWRRAGEHRATLAFLASFVVAVWLSYLFYAPFGIWLYLRFLLPSFPVMLVLAAAGLALLLARMRETGERRAVAILVVAAVFSLRVSFIREEQVLGHWREGIPYTSVGEYVRRTLPKNAVVITMLQSGSIRYYGQRLTMRWDYLDPAWWPRAADVLVERGYRPYLLLADHEEKTFRSRFGLSSTQEDAPGTIVAAFNGTEKDRIYDPLRQRSAAPASIPPFRTHPCGCLQP
jgi:hypothetical protein